MTNEQYRRANRHALPVILILLGYMVFMMVGVILEGKGIGATYFQLILNIVCFIVVLVTFLPKEIRRQVRLSCCQQWEYLLQLI